MNKPTFHPSPNSTCPVCSKFFVARKRYEKDRKPHQRYCSKKCYWSRPSMDLGEARDRQSIAVNKWRLKNKDRNRASQRKRSDQWNKNNPDKRKSSLQLQGAVRSGKILKPDSCSECGKKAAGHGLQGHHEDHAKPLEVIWLCAKCHKHLHAIVMGDRFINMKRLGMG